MSKTSKPHTDIDTQKFILNKFYQSINAISFSHFITNTFNLYILADLARNTLLAMRCTEVDIEIVEMFGSRRQSVQPHLIIFCFCDFISKITSESINIQTMLKEM